MLRIIAIAASTIALIYFLLYLKSKWDVLPPQSKKSIFMLGIGSLANLVRRNWRSILAIISKVLRK